MQMMMLSLLRHISGRSIVMKYKLLRMPSCNLRLLHSAILGPFLTLLFCYYCVTSVILIITPLPHYPSDITHYVGLNHSQSSLIIGHTNWTSQTHPEVLHQKHPEALSNLHEGMRVSLKIFDE